MVHWQAELSSLRTAQTEDPQLEKKYAGNIRPIRPAGSEPTHPEGLRFFMAACLVRRQTSEGEELHPAVVTFMAKSEDLARQAAPALCRQFYPERAGWSIEAVEVDAAPTELHAFYNDRFVTFDVQVVLVPRVDG
jgi:hypothetical protein